MLVWSNWLSYGVFKLYSNLVKLEIVTVLKILLFWVSLLCGLVYRYECYRGTYYFHLHNVILEQTTLVLLHSSLWLTSSTSCEHFMLWWLWAILSHFKLSAGRSTVSMRESKAVLMIWPWWQMGNSQVLSNTAVWVLLIFHHQYWH